jgi:site-specific recombinase XerD
MVAETNGEVQAAPRVLRLKKGGGVPMKAHLSLEEARALVEAVFPGVADLEGRLARSTVHQYMLDCLLFLAFCKGDPAVARDPASLLAWRQHMVSETEMSPFTINRRLASVKSVVRATARRRAIPAEVDAEFHLVELCSTSAMRHRMKRTRNRLVPEEVRRICRAPNASTLVGLRNRAFLLCLASSGCRLGEVVSLTRASIQHDGERLVVEVWGKGQARERLAPLLHEALEWTERWLAARARFLETAPIFTRFVNRTAIPTGQPLSNAAAYNLFKGYAARVGLPYVMPRDFRKFVASEIARRFGLSEAQHVLGHRMITTTQASYVLDSFLARVTDGLF